MKMRKYLPPLASAVAVALSAAAPAHDGGFSEIHAVFVMTNDADSNEVIAYQRTPYGTLFAPHRFRTGGRGSGGKVDPLASQGSLTLSEDHQWLFAVNAGSGTLSVFRVNGPLLQLTDQIATGGAEPTSVTQRGNLVYVLNAAGSSSVTGFLFRNGRLNELPNAQAFLSANGANPGSVDFSSDGKFLYSTNSGGGQIGAFGINPDGTLTNLGTSGALPAAAGLNGIAAN